MYSLLLVEDDVRIADDLKLRLNDEGFDVSVVYDGLLAEKLIMRSPFHCVLLDVNLPGKNGFDICKAVREQGNRVPILMLTAFGEMDDKLQGFDCGADDYMTKPFYFKEVLARVRSLIKRGPATGDSEQVFHCEDLTIDTRSKKASRGGNAVRLTQREFEILSELAAAKGEIVSKKDLIRKIWGTSVEVNTNTIEVFINSIRNKIDKGNSIKLIHTRSGFGYFLSSQPDET